MEERNEKTIHDSNGFEVLGAGARETAREVEAKLAPRRRWRLAASALAPLALLAACSGSAQAPSSPASEGDAKGYGYEFDLDSQKAAAAARASEASAPPGPGGRLAPEAIQAAVRAHFGAFRTCYEGGLAKQAKLAGKVTVKLVIGEDGETKTSADEHSTMPDKEVVGCIVGEFRKISYPKTHGGNVTAIYPIEFAP